MITYANELLLLILLVISKVYCGTRCATAVGTVHCRINSTMAMDVEVFLMDDDGIGNPDDQMGWNTADENGRFKVEGCGYDFLSDPDPFVKIFTYCNSPKGKYIKTKVVHIFAPDIIDYGDIDLD
uniref:Transthyretin-like family protein n=1 Tax=Romanomermis culicivorax TaxID=13658 RepID=A0A915JTA1_ROMCU